MLHVEMAYIYIMLWGHGEIITVQIDYIINWSGRLGYCLSFIERSFYIRRVFSYKAQTWYFHIYSLYKGFILYGPFGIGKEDLLLLIIMLLMLFMHW